MAEKGSGDNPRRAVRSDRIRNRERILGAAREVFAASGIHAPLDRIATAAGVGSGTLYRHFPTRAALWTAVLDEPLKRHLAEVDEALADPDPWEGFSRFVYAICGLDAAPGGYTGLLNTRFDDAAELQELRAGIQLGITRIFHRAHAAGVIRPDVTTEDLFFIILANTAVVEATRDIAPEAWKRNVALYLDALRPVNSSVLPAPPLSVRELVEAVSRSPRASRQS